MNVIEELEGLKRPYCAINYDKYNNGVIDSIAIVKKHLEYDCEKSKVCDNSEYDKLNKAVDEFAIKMKARLFEKMNQGYTGWDSNYPASELCNQIISDAMDVFNGKGKIAMSIDIANRAMMLSLRNLSFPQPVAEQPLDATAKLIRQMDEAQTKTANSKLHFGPVAEQPTCDCKHCGHNVDEVCNLGRGCNGRVDWIPKQPAAAEKQPTTTLEARELLSVLQDMASILLVLSIGDEQAVDLTKMLADKLGKMLEKLEERK